MSVSLFFTLITLVTVIYRVMQEPRTSFGSRFLMLNNILQVMNLVFQLHRAAVTFFGGTLLRTCVAVVSIEAKTTDEVESCLALQSN